MMYCLVIFKQHTIPPTPFFLRHNSCVLVQRCEPQSHKLLSLSLPPTYWHTSIVHNVRCLLQ